jgi:hypothetical protein
MSQVEETTEELSDPCTFCGEGETCHHGVGCWNCCLDCRREEEAAENVNLREVVTDVINMLQKATSGTTPRLTNG